MIKLFSSSTFIGLESTPNGIKGASVIAGGKTPSLNNLFLLHPEMDDVKQLYIGHPLLISALDGKEVLVRSLYIPLTKDKDIEEALAFQAEPILPYKIDEALLSYQILNKGQDGTNILLFAVRKEALEAHLNQWQNIRIEPEKISSIQTALSQFSQTYLPLDKTYLIFHLQRHEMTGILIKEGQLYASFALPDGLAPFFAAYTEEGKDSLPQNAEQWTTFLLQNHLQLAEIVKKLQKEIAKMGYALAKEVKNQEISGIVVTGEIAEYEGLSQILIQNLPFPLVNCPAYGDYTSSQMMSYAVPLGLALSSLPGKSCPIDFRQEEWSYPHPWKRLRIPIALYFVSIFFLSFAFYFFSQQYILYQEDRLRQSYIDLLGNMRKSHEQFEIAFLTKNPKAHDEFEGEIPKIEFINQEGLMNRLSFLQKELQTTPDSFPLFANVPRVSDVLAWLSHHPAIATFDENGDPEARLQIENFNYIMVKRPQHGKKQDKYQVKIELEFASSTPKWAREFHDALINPNDWVDSKGEVKWNTNRGKYKTSFFLKDKTSYPSI